MGPHRLNLPTRPEWFFDYEKYGGSSAILLHIKLINFYFSPAHQRQRLYHQAPEILAPQFPKFEDFGEITIHGDKGEVI